MITPPTGLHDRVLTSIGRDLCDGSLPAGSVLSLELLSARYGASRTVLREVVRVLESMHVVDSRRRVGVTVRPLADWDVFDPRIVQWRLDSPQRAVQLASLGELRLGAEPVAAALAARRASAEQCGALTEAVIGMSVTGRAGDLQSYLAHDVTFHRTVLAASGNEMLRALADIVEQVLTGRTHHNLMPRRPNPAAIRLHGDVAEAIAGGDAVAAEDAMRHIVVESMQAIEAAVQADGPPGRSTVDTSSE